MRTIKFRCWYKREQKFVYLNEIHFFGSDDGGGLASIDFNNNEIEFTSDVINDMVGNKEIPFTLMQYTGLKDKLGVEIYEGDILELYSSEDAKWFKEVVEWDKKHSGFMPFIDCSEQIGVGYVWGCLEDDIRIIGNIYETPELEAR